MFFHLLMILEDVMAKNLAVLPRNYMSTLYAVQLVILYPNSTDIYGVTESYGDWYATQPQ